MDIFKLMPNKRKFLDRIIGISLILMSVAIGAFFLPDLWPLIKKTSFLMLEPGAPLVKQGLWDDWFMQAIGWTFAILLFQNGRAFLSYGKKTS